MNLALKARGLGLACCVPGAPTHSQLTTPQGERGLTLTPEVLWIHSGPVGNLTELTLSLHHPSSYLLPEPSSCPASVSPGCSFPSFLLCQTDRNHHQTDLFSFYVSFPLRPAASYHLGDPFTSIPPPLVCAAGKQQRPDCESCPLDGAGLGLCLAERWALGWAGSPSADQASGARGHLSM